MTQVTALKMIEARHFENRKENTFEKELTVEL